MTRRGPKPKPRRLSVSIPERAGPHVKLIFAEMARQGFTYDEMEYRSGVLRTTLKAWRHKNAPSLSNIEAILSVLGFDFLPVPRAAVLPPEVVEGLTPIADRLGLSMPEAVKALAEIVAGVHARLDATSRPESEPVVKLPAKRARRAFIHPDQELLFDVAA